jgi:hypothetical protein
MVKKICLLILVAAAACSAPISDTPRSSEKIGYVILISGSWLDGKSLLKSGSPIYERSRIVRQKKTDHDSITIRVNGSRRYIACSESSNCPEPLTFHGQPEGTLLFPDPETGKYRSLRELPERIFASADRAGENSSPVEAVLIKSPAGLVLRDAMPQGIGSGEAILFCPVAEDGSLNCGQPENPGALKCETPGFAPCSIQPVPGLYWLHVFQREERYGRAAYDIIDGRTALVLVLDDNPGMVVKRGFHSFSAQLYAYAEEQHSPHRTDPLRMYLYEAWFGRER